MHILLTDITTCPRCGPGFGLILMVEDISERRVQTGWLGCANCRERYRIAAGIADLRTGAADSAPAADPAPARSADGPAAPAKASSELDAARLAALMGVAEGPAYLLLVGPVTRFAADLADLLTDVHVIAVDRDAVPAPPHPDVTRVQVTRALPFHSGRLHGAVLSGAAATELLAEAARVLRPSARLVLIDGTAGAAERLAHAGLSVAATGAGVAVAVRRQ